MYSVSRTIPVFSENLLLDGNGSSIGLYDSFEVPALEAVLEIYDDDEILSGDTLDLTKDDFGQNGRISSGGFENDAENSHFFVELFLKLEDSDGNVYWLAEIEYEGMPDDVSSDLFAFVGAAAPQGTLLTVVGVSSTYFGSDSVSYDQLAVATDVVEVVSYEGGTLNYDVSSENQVHTENTTFDLVQNFDETFDDRKADRMDLDFDRDRRSETGAGEVELRVNIDHHQFDNLDMDRVTAVDTTKLEAWLFEQGATSITEIETDLGSYDLEIDVKAEGFGGLGGSESDVEALLSISAPLLGIEYLDNNGDIQTAEIELDFSLEDVPASALSFDLNGNGVIDTKTDTSGEWIDGTGDGVLIDVSEARSQVVSEDALFGDEGGRYSDGYEKLSGLDRNKDGVVSGSELSGLSIWVDDGNRILEEGELVSLDSIGLTELSLETSFDLSGNKISITDLDKEKLGEANYTLSGADADLFVIDQQNGRVDWAAGEAPSTDAAGDADADSVYEVSILESGQTLETLSIEVNAAPLIDEVTGEPTREGRLMDDDADFFGKISALMTQGWAAGYNILGDLIGDDDRDYIYDRDGDSSIFTMGGNDRVYGADGDDKIYGADGDDDLHGGNGQDILDGGAGYDKLTGGDGIDVFVFRAGDGTTEIEDFELSHDILDVEGFDNLTYDQLTNAGEQIGDDVYYTLGEDTLILRDVELETMVEVDLCMR